jgi:uncharacterized membrane protein
MKLEAFFRYDVDLSKFNEKYFEKLEINEQKQILIKCLDKNHLPAVGDLCEYCPYREATGKKLLAIHNSLKAQHD